MTPSRLSVIVSFFCRRSVWWMAALMFAGFCLRAWGLDFGLPNDSRIEESPLVQVCLQNILTPLMLQGDTSLNPHSFTTPGLYFYLVSPLILLYYGLGHLSGWFPDWQGFLAQWQNDPTALHLILRGFSVACGMAMIPATYALGRQLGNRTIGWLSAILITTSYLLVRTAHFGTPDTPMTLGVILSLTGILAYSRKPDNTRLLWACVAIGLTLGLGYAAILLLVPLLIVLLAPHWQAEWIDWPGFFRTLGKPLAWIAGVFFLASPWTLLDYTAFWQTLQSSLTAFFLPTLPGLETGWSFYPRLALFYGLGGWTLAMAALGIRTAWRCATPTERWRHTAMLAFLISALALLGFHAQPQSIHALPLTPVILLYAAIGIARAAQLVSRLLQWHPPQAATWPRKHLTLLAVLSVALYQPLSTALAFDRLVAQPDTRALARQWILQNVPPQAVATGPWTGRIRLPLDYGQLFNNPGITPAGAPAAPRIVEVDPRTRITNTYAIPAMLHDLGVRYVVLYRGIPPLSNPPSDFEGLSRAEKPLLQLSPLLRNISREELEDSPPIFDTLEAFGLPFANLDNFERPGPEIYILDLAAPAPKPGGKTS